MSKKEEVIGECRICGYFGKLSFEHVPPKSAFNNNKFFYKTTIENLTGREESFLGQDYKQLYKERLLEKEQGGIGFNTLCKKCNNQTGRWYGGAFVDWAYQAMGLLLKTKGQPTLYYPTYFYPLRVIKQIVTMFFSINSEGFKENAPELVKFVKDKEDRFMPKQYKIYCYYNVEGKYRYIGNNVKYSKGQLMTLSEITFPPFGFVMTNNSSSPDSRLVDISHFSFSSYDKWTDNYQRFATLPTHLPYIPGDYRTKEELKQIMISSKNDRQKY